MRMIGFRVEPVKVTFAVYDEKEKQIINVEALKVPEALELPERLKYIRNNVLDILREYDIQKAVIRVTESSAQRPNKERLQSEAVIQEAFASSQLLKYAVVQIASLAPLINVVRTDIKKYVANDLNYDLVENWSTLNSSEREAVLCAVGAANV